MPSNVFARARKRVRKSGSVIASMQPVVILAAAAFMLAGCAERPIAGQESFQESSRVAEALGRLAKLSDHGASVPVSSVARFAWSDVCHYSAADEPALEAKVGRLLARYYLDESRGGAASTDLMVFLLDGRPVHAFGLSSTGVSRLGNGRCYSRTDATVTVESMQRMVLDERPLRNSGSQHVPGSARYQGSYSEQPESARRAEPAPIMVGFAGRDLLRRY